jgi:hypothetical protein
MQWRIQWQWQLNIISYGNVAMAKYVWLMCVYHMWLMSIVANLALASNVPLNG